jgi:hypothetical protein
VRSKVSVCHQRRRTPRILSHTNLEALICNRFRKVGSFLHSREFLGRIHGKGRGVHGGTVIHFLADVSLISFLNVLDNFEKSQLELVPSFFSNAQVGEDEERRIGVVDVFQVVQGRYRSSRKEPCFAVVDDMQFILLFIASNQTGKKEVIRVWY